MFAPVMLIRYTVKKKLLMGFPLSRRQGHTRLVYTALNRWHATSNIDSISL